MKEYDFTDNEIKQSRESFPISSETFSDKEYFRPSKTEYFQSAEKEQAPVVVIDEDEEEKEKKRRRRMQKKAKELMTRTGYLVASVVAVFMLAAAVPGWEKDFRRGAANEDTITSMVCDAVDRKGISAMLTFYDSNGRTVISVRSGSNGAYDVTLPAGEYSVLLSASGYIEDELTFYQPQDGKVEQVFAMSAELSMGQMRIVLQWGENPSDLDSHLFGTGRNNTALHVYYSNMDGYTDILPGSSEARLIAMLDVDDTSSYGPETTTILDLNTSYVYCVYDYSSGDNPDRSMLDKSQAIIKVYTYGSSVPRVFELPSGHGTWWNVFKINNGIIVPIQTITNEPDY